MGRTRAVPQPASLVDATVTLYCRSTEKRVERARELYKERLQAEIGKTRRLHGYAASYNIRSVEGAKHKYALVFGTAHEKGIALASDVVNNIEKQGQVDQSLLIGQTSLFQSDWSQQSQPLVDEMISKSLADFIRDRYTGRTMDRLELQANLMPEKFGQFGKGHLTEALNLLKTQRKLTFVTGTASQDHARFKIT